MMLTNIAWALFVGAGLGALLTYALYRYDRKHIGPHLFNMEDPSYPYSVDKDGGFHTNFDHPETKDRIAAQLGSLRTDPADVRKRTFTEDGRYNWIVHNEYHMTLWLVDDWLQYWPTKSKWRWHCRTYTGNVEAFVAEQVAEGGT